MKTRRILISLMVLFIHFMSNAQGLMFKGSENSITDRTSYDVFVSRIPAFDDVLRVEFSLAMHMPSDFGYILRIKNDVEGRVFNLLYSGEHWDNEFPLRLNEEGKSSIIKADIPHEYFKMGKWMRVRLEFVMDEGKVSLDVDDFHYETHISPMSDKWSPILHFGKSEYIIDVPSMAIKELTVSDRKKNYVFPLTECNGEKVYETKKKIYGLATNPQWLMNKGYNWEKVADFSSDSRAGANYDRFKKEVLYFNRDRLSIYNFKNKSITHNVYQCQCPVDLYLGSSFINPLDSLLYIYEPYVESQTGRVPTLASYDTHSGDWTVRSYDTLPYRFHHHASCIDEDRNRFVLFGGFGSMMYNGNFYSCGLDEFIWQQDTLSAAGDRIFPRYFASMGYSSSENAVYIFGGMGNESGEQIVGRHYFYDLHKVDLSTGVDSLVWGGDGPVLDWKEENMVPVRNMILTEDGFYTICYPEFLTDSYLQLMYFDFQTATYKKLGSKVPIRSDKISTNANLYFDEDLQQLILTVMESPDDVQSNLTVYTLAYPPLSETEYFYLNKKTYTWLLLLIGLLGLASLFALYRRYTRNRVLLERAVHESRYDFEQKVHNSICLFGGFMAIDPDGNEVTFPYQQKKLLCLILKYSLDNGISSTRLSKIMWPDKEEDKAKNSRGVAINHLRKLLDRFQGAHLLFEDGHFKIHCEPGFFCDWMELKKETSKEVPDINVIMRVVLRGKFMPFIEDPVFDSFKESTETQIVGLLSTELFAAYGKKRYRDVLDIVEAIYLTDPLNEQALETHVNALVKMHRTEDALVRYSSFVKEYKFVYEMEYERDFKSLIKN